MMVLEVLSYELMRGGQHKVGVLVVLGVCLLLYFGAHAVSMDRISQLHVSQSAQPDAPKVFLLSTRAGCLGIVADTVIFYDYDWVRLLAFLPAFILSIYPRDRTHNPSTSQSVPNRSDEPFPSLSFHQCEDRILKKATLSRKLDVLVIAKGIFIVPFSFAPFSC